jgi:hypothetical protein
LDDANQVGRIRHIAIVQHHLDLGLVRVLVQMIDTVGIEGLGTTLYAVHFVPSIKQKLRQLGSILAWYSGD